MISDIINGNISFDKARYVPKDYFNSIQEERKPRYGDILFTVTGSYGVPVKVKTKKPFCFQRHIGLIRPLLIGKILYWWLQSAYIKGICDEKATGTAQKTVSLSMLRELLVPLPPKKEQERIVAEINEIHSLIEGISESRNNISESIRKAKLKILDLAMQGKLVPQDPADEPAAEMLRRVNPKAKIITDNPHSWNIPYGWGMVTLKGLIDSPSSKPYQIFQSEIIQTGKFPVISQSSNFIEGYSNSCDKVFHSNNGIVIFGDHTKIVKFYSNDFIIGADGVKLIDWDYNKRFLFYLVKYISERIPNKGYSRHFQYLLKYVVGLPPLREQKRIVAKIEELDSVLDEIEASLQS